jgi:peptide chain release factor 2
MQSPTFWDSQEKAQKVVAELKQVKAQITPLGKLQDRFEDAKVAYELAKEASDNDLLTEADEELFQLVQDMDRVELQSLLSGKHDFRNCFFTINAGDGGTEANDWAEMLMRMYIYYFEKMRWKVEEVAKTFGSEVGIDGVTFHIKGDMAYGYLNCERGTHRLARVSPFNAQGKRQTSFATVDVVPEFDNADVEIDENEIEVVAFARSSGPGGQNVNKLATAIRIVHIPTGISVVASNERKQEQNRKQAMAILQAKLEQLEEEKREAELAEVTGGAVDRGWGTQIRSYVIYDNRVKDHRTGHEVGTPQQVLNGDLQGFIDAELKRRRKAKVETTPG